jgi:YD repeat-containing protein
VCRCGKGGVTRALKSGKEADDARETDRRGQIHEYTYDDLNFQTDAWLRATEQAPAIHLDQVARDLVGNAVSQTDRFGHTVAFKYDGLDRQTRRARAWG